MHPSQPAPASWKMVGTKSCTCTMSLMIWEITTSIPNTSPVRVALCPACDKLTSK